MSSLDYSCVTPHDSVKERRDSQKTYIFFPNNSLVFPSVMKQHCSHESPRLGENHRRAFLHLVTQTLVDLCWFRNFHMQRWMVLRAGSIRILFVSLSYRWLSVPKYICSGSVLTVSTIWGMSTLLCISIVIYFIFPLRCILEANIVTFQPTFIGKLKL